MMSFTSSVAGNPSNCLHEVVAWCLQQYSHSSREHFRALRSFWVFFLLPWLARPWLRLDLNAMNEKEAMTETEMRYSRTKRLDGCWWGCIVERASAVRVHLPPPQVSAQVPSAPRTASRGHECGFRRLCALTVPSNSSSRVDVNGASQSQGS